MMEIFTIIVLCAAMFGIGVLFGAETSVKQPKNAKTKDLNDASDNELMLLFIAVGCELEKRGIVEDVERKPFDELKK